MCGYGLTDLGQEDVGEIVCRRLEDAAKDLAHQQEQGTVDAPVP